MSFRAPLSAMIFMALCACGPSLREESRWPLMQKPTNNAGTFVVRSTDAQCLARTPEIMENFFSGIASVSDVDQAWRCSSRALQLFSLYIRGRDDRQYSAGELRAFLEIFFLGNLKINDELLMQLMKIKQLFLGGSATHLRIEELSLFTELFSNFNRIMQRLQPHMKLFSISPTEAAKDESINQKVEIGRRELLQAAHDLSGLLSRSQVNYRVSDLHSLLNEMAHLQTPKGTWQGPQKVLEVVPLLHAFRVALTAAPDDLIRPTDWEKTLSLGARVYAQWLRYQLTFDRKYWPSEGLFFRVAEFGFETLDIMEEAVRGHPGELAEYEIFENLLEKLSELDLVPFGLTLKTAISILRPLAQHYLRDWHNPHKEFGAQRGVSLHTLTQARRAFEVWVQNQLAINLDLGVATTQNFRHLTAQYSSQMENLRSRAQHLIIDRSNRLLFKRADELPKYDLFSLSQMNWRHIFVRLAVHGYAEDPKRAVELSNVTKDEFRKFHDDIRFFARELEILDPREPGIWNTIFTQADIFSLSADGDQRLSFYEAHELVTYAQSVSGTNRDALQAAIKTAQSEERERKLPPGSLVGDLDVFGSPMIDARTFRRVYQDNFAMIYSNMPRLVRFFFSLSPEQARVFINTLEAGGRCMGNDDHNKYESSDLDKYTMMFHFVESLFLRLDPNDRGYLTEVEIDQLFPYVLPLLQRLRPGVSVANLRTAFIYILVEGKEPARWQVFARSMGAYIPGSVYEYIYNYVPDWIMGEKGLRITRMNVFKLFAVLRGSDSQPLQVNGQSYSQKDFCGPVARWPLPAYPFDTAEK